MSLNPEICGRCRHLHKRAIGGVESVGSDNPDLICIFPHPEKEDDDGHPLEGPDGSKIKKVLDKYKGRYRILYTLRCPNYDNFISRAMHKDPAPSVMSNCLGHIKEEIKNYPGKLVMTFGSTSYKYFSGDYEVKISKEYGIMRKVKFDGTEYDVIPNLDPGMIGRHVQNLKDIETHIDKAFDYIDVPPIPIDDKFSVLPPERALKFLNSVVRLYESGEIDHCLFDIENSVSLDPVHGGEVIMVSVAHDKDDRAYSIPLYVTNEIHHWKKVEKEKAGKYAPDSKYAQVFPNNFKRIKANPDGSLQVPDLTFDVPTIDFDVSEVQRAKLRAAIGVLLAKVPISGHNLKHDVKWCTARGICDISKVRIWRDTNNDSVQYQSMGGGIDNSLKGLSRRYFHVGENWETEIDEYLEKFRLKKDRHYGQIPTGILGRYAALDVYYNKLLEKKLLAMMPDHVKAAADMVTRAIVPMTEPEIKGIQFSERTYNYLRNRYYEYLTMKRGQIEGLPVVKRFMAKYLAPLQEENLKRKVPKSQEEINEKAFNFNYSVKCNEIAYGVNFYALPENEEFYSKDTGNMSFDKDTRKWLLDEVLSDRALAKMADNHEMAPYVPLYQEAKVYVSKFSDWKRVSKLLKDYIESFPENMKDFMFYTKFNINGTVTGRMSSPFHSMPNGCDIKRLVSSRWANKGGLILAADQSQLELRIVAALSNERSLIDSFIAGVDAHTATGAIVAGVPVDKVTKVQRQRGKTVNFAILYGKTIYNLAIDLNCSEQEAASIINGFYSRVPDLLKWKHQVEELTMSTGYVDTMFGRRIPIPAAHSKRDSDIEETKRLAVNYRVQSAASDLVLNQVVDTWNDAKRESLKSILLATVHDSVEYDVYPGELFKLVRIFKTNGELEIQNRYPWVTCPLRLDVELGTSWGGSLKCEIEHFDDSTLIFDTEAQKKDFMLFVQQASLAYDVQYEISEESPIDASSLREDVFFNSDKIIKARVVMQSRT